VVAAATPGEFVVNAIPNKRGRHLRPSPGAEMRGLKFN
jgi:hypothetical protein